MSISRCLIVVTLFMLLAVSAGCTSLAIGDVKYSGQGLSVHVTNTGDPVDAGIQVRIYEVKDLAQHELTVTGIPILVLRGENDLNVPVKLNPGTYKLYVYMTVNSERRTATIRDIVI